MEGPALTDLHTHILPGLDDGAASLDDAADMAGAALEDGISRLAATPHSLRWAPGIGRAALEAKVQALTQSLAARGLGVTVVPGAEMALISSLPQQIDAGEAVTLNGSRYLLVELPLTGLPPRLEDILFQVRVRGLVPILAHPERSTDLRRDLRLLRRLVERGLLLQVTAGSLEGRFGAGPQGFACRLLRERLVHVIASDAHDPRDRSPRLTRAQAVAARVVGPEEALALVATNPARILDDLPLELEPPRPPRRWFGRWLAPMQ